MSDKCLWLRDNYRQYFGKLQIDAIKFIKLSHLVSSSDDINIYIQSSRKLFQICRTKCPASLQCSAGHFDPLLDIFLS